MTHAPESIRRYKRSRFSTRLPVEYLYTASHFWLTEVEPGTWRIGLTKFAIRMLGEIVEHEFEVQAGAKVEVGQVIGWIEGFKAASDLYCVAAGSFKGGNPALDDDVNLVDSDPYQKGWLYDIEGSPDPEAMNIDQYVSLLDTTIDALIGQYDSDDEQAADQDQTTAKPDEQDHE